MIKELGNDKYSIETNDDFNSAIGHTLDALSPFTKKTNNFVGIQQIAFNRGLMARLVIDRFLAEYELDKDDRIEIDVTGPFKFTIYLVNRDDGVSYSVV